MYIWPSDGPGGAPRGRGIAEPQVCSEEDAMTIWNTNGAAANIGKGGVHWPQRRGEQEVATKIGRDSMYLKGDMEAGGSEDSTIEGTESEKKRGT